MLHEKFNYIIDKNWYKTNLRNQINFISPVEGRFWSQVNILKFGIIVYSKCCTGFET